MTIDVWDSLRRLFGVKTKAMPSPAPRVQRRPWPFMAGRQR